MDARALMMAAAERGDVEAAPPGQVLFDVPGTYIWTCPPGVTSVCVVCVGGGASGRGVRNETGYSAYGGGGGSLAWRNNIQVQPGIDYAVVVGSGGASVSITTSIIAAGGYSGGTSYFGSADIVSAKGGAPGNIRTRQGFVGQGGGSGGLGGAPENGYATGGGGAGGYSSNTSTSGLGAPSDSTSFNGYNGGGGGGGPGGGSRPSTGYLVPGDGGGVGVKGMGSIGLGTSILGQAGGDGSGGSYGYGGAGIYFSNTTGATRRGGHGAVRIIWGEGRAFPSTNTGDV